VACHNINIRPLSVLCVFMSVDEPIQERCVCEQRELPTRASPYTVSGSDLRCSAAQYTTLQVYALAMLQLMIVRWAALVLLVPSFVQIGRTGLQV